MFKIITSCICGLALVYGSVKYDPMAEWLARYEKKFEWVAESTVDLITGFEGYRNKPYIDGAGKWTIGVGHQITPKEFKTLHRELSDAEVRGLLHQDLKKCSDALESALKVMVNRQQADALHSLCHNIGPDRMMQSDVIKYMNQGDNKKAANAFMNWTNPGLTRRRQAEKALFLANE